MQGPQRMLARMSPPRSLIRPNDNGLRSTSIRPCERSKAYPRPRSLRMPIRASVARTVFVVLLAASRTLPGQGTARGVVLTDSHFHLTNYIQRGPTLKQFLALLGDSIGRVAVFGIPLQQEWLDAVTGENAPTYYLHSDAPLYYYSFTDANIAMEYRALSPAEQARVDPQIPGLHVRGR